MARRSVAAEVTWHPSQLLTLAIGTVYALVGILGFLVTGVALWPARRTARGRFAGRDA